MLNKLTGRGARKTLFFMLLIAAFVESPAHAESCAGLMDDVTLVACADKELQQIKGVSIEQNRWESDSFDAVEIDAGPSLIQPVKF